MTINAHERLRAVYKGNGVQTDWPVTFPFIGAADVCAMTIAPDGTETILVNNRDFTVSARADRSGGVLHTVLPANYKLVMYLDQPCTQEVDLRNNGILDAEVLEYGMDKLTLLIAQLREGLSRAIKVGVGSEETPEALTERIFTAHGESVESAKDAAASKDSAAKSAASAQASASSASASEALARKWATNPENAVVKNGEYSAYHWAKQANAIAVSEAFIADGSTTARNLAERSADVINAKDYGAKGNGTADDTEALRAALGKGGQVFLPPGTYRISEDIPLERCYGADALILFSTGSRVALSCPANVDNLSQSYFTDLYSAKTITFQEIAMNDGKIYCIQNPSSPNGTWDVTSEAYISEFVSARRADDFQLPNLNTTVKPTGIATFTRLGHGSGLSALILDGKTYLYATIYDDKSANGSGFTKILWKGSATTQADVQEFRSLKGVRAGAEIAISSDGKYLVVHDMNYMYASQGGRWEIFRYLVFDRKALETAADMSTVEPLSSWYARSTAASRSILGNTSGCQGICSDGRYVYSLISGTNKLDSDAAIIDVYTMTGVWVKSIPINALGPVFPGKIYGTESGYIVTGYEVEGLTVQDDALYVGLKVIAQKYSAIVDYYGTSYVPLVTGTGVNPSTSANFLRTMAPATEVYDPAKQYTGVSGPVYHKVILAIAPSGTRSGERPLLIAEDRSPPAAIKTSGHLLLACDNTNQIQLSGWDLKSGTLIPRMQVGGTGNVYFYRPGIMGQDPPLYAQNPPKYTMFTYNADGTTLRAASSQAEGATMLLADTDHADASLAGGAVIYVSGTETTAPNRGFLLQRDGKATFYGATVSPRYENTTSLGDSTHRFVNLYMTGDIIKTSDERLKEDIQEVPEAVFRAWDKVRFMQFRFRLSVAKKGGSARLHVGLVAQKIKDAFESEGLDPFAYGLLCYDAWPEAELTEDVFDPETGNTVPKTVTRPAGDMYAVNYDEALAMECAYQRWRIGRIEEAVAGGGG